ncbi:Peptidyl-prolyl cis-trans isomerase pin4 [Tilletia horrida]|nr:Peptidyl-prolyl cis-trans isomerase pin4 [Tilletia horrida]
MDSLNNTFPSLSLGSNNNSSNSGSNDQQQQNQQSAAARFERFFSSGPSDPATSLLSPSASSSSPAPPSSASATTPSAHRFSPATISAGTGPNASSHNLSANGAFAAFHLAPPGSGQHHHATIGPGSSAGPTLRSQSSRSALPQAWTSGAGSGANAGAGGAGPNSAVGPDGTPLNPDDDIIPTAIVVKNIRFDVKREQLLSIMEELSLPIPYAFNYHFDQGVFRGLAFGNFRSAEDADQVVAALNGFDVMGRKLRVEYKKVLQAGEKERIEKEKAIKRMQSMQMEKERRKMQEEYAMAAAAAAAGMPAGLVPPQSHLGYGLGSTPVPPMPPLPTFHTTDTAGNNLSWNPNAGAAGPYQVPQQTQQQAAGLAYPSDAASATSPTLSNTSGGGGLSSTVRSTYASDLFSPTGSASSPITNSSKNSNPFGIAPGSGQTTGVGGIPRVIAPPAGSAASGGGESGAGASSTNGAAPPAPGSTTSASASGMSKRAEELDLNDPATLEIYSRVLLFRDDRMRDELSFSRNLSPSERRTVHLVAQRLGLYHYSMGEGDERYVIVTKNEVTQPNRSLRSQASTIGRSNRDAYAAAMASGGSGGGGGSSGLLSANNSGLLYPHATTGRAGAASLLRMKKSAPDMKRYETGPESNLGLGGGGGSGSAGLGGPQGPGSGALTPSGASSGFFSSGAGTIHGGLSPGRNLFGGSDRKSKMSP